MTKTILITGGSSGLGKALAISLARAGHRIFVTLRNPTDNTFQDYPNINVLPMDVCNETSIKNAVYNLRKDFSCNGLDVLINNAGIAVSGPLELADKTEMYRQFEVNLFGMLTVCQHFLPLLKEKKGKILQIGSMSSRMAIPFVGLYGASKAALKQLSWSLRLELKPWNVEVCHLELGNFPSAIWEKTDLDDSALEQNPYGPYLLNIKALMKSRSRSFNPVELLCRKVEEMIQRSKNPFNTIIGTDAQKRRILTAFLPHRLLESSLLKILHMPQS